MKNFKAGHWINQGTYKSFQPNLINRAWRLDHMELQQLLGQADRHLGRLDMYSDYVPNIELFISMHVLKEATQSSRIEGTQTHIEDALLEREDIPAEKRADWEEVQNYIDAYRRYKPIDRKTGHAAVLLPTNPRGAWRADEGRSR